MKALSFILVVVFLFSGSAFGQFPAASKEHDVLKQEAGKWDAEVIMLMGPAGPYNPPQKSKGVEVNKLVGDFW
ncbi:MAG: DUF1579 family protein, partial [Planctomycetota bacterium]